MGGSEERLGAVTLAAEIPSHLLSTLSLFIYLGANYKAQGWSWGTALEKVTGGLEGSLGAHPSMGRAVSFLPVCFQTS